MKTIKIDSWSKANKSALLQAVVSVLFCVAYSFVIFFLTGGEEFIGKDANKEIINGIRFDVALIVCGALAVIIPTMLLRYKKSKFLILYLPLSIVYYVIIMFVCICIFDGYNVFDLINYAITSMPIGSFVGTVIAILINIIKINNFSRLTPSPKRKITEYDGEGGIRSVLKNHAVPQMPDWNEIVEMLYDKNLDCFEDEVVKVIYSKDKAMRYVVLKSDKGFFTYRLEKIYRLDEEEWNIRCGFDLTPAFWQEIDNGNKSLFSSLDEALTELKQEAEYKFFDLT